MDRHYDSNNKERYGGGYDRRRSGGKYQDRIPERDSYRPQREEKPSMPLIDEDIEDIDNFDNMNLKENILRGIYGYGFERPSVIQSRGIVPVANGNDIIAQSQSGTGKTGTFVIGTLQRIDENETGCQGIIVAPTRELAIQIQDVCECIGHYTKVKTVLCIGKSDMNQFKTEVSDGATLVVGTPGRINDMIEREFLPIDKIKILTLDEADEMLSEGFQEQIQKIVSSIPKESQICLFSATIPRPVLYLANSFIPKAKMILVKKEELTLEGIRQFYIEMDNESWKLDTFIDLFEVMSVSQTIVYVNSKKRAEWLQAELKDKQFTVSIIHGNMTPMERSAVMKDFRNGATRILVSTDLLARGIDVQQVSIVINYDMPYKMESYLHRIGRSGRFGRKGVAINFMGYKDRRTLSDIMRFYSTEIQPMPRNIQDYIN